MITVVWWYQCTPRGVCQMTEEVWGVWYAPAAFGVLTAALAFVLRACVGWCTWTLLEPNMLERAKRKREHSDQRGCSLCGAVSDFFGVSWTFRGLLNLNHLLWTSLLLALHSFVGIPKVQILRRSMPTHTHITFSVGAHSSWVAADLRTTVPFAAPDPAARLHNLWSDLLSWLVFSPSLSKRSLTSLHSTFCFISIFLPRAAVHTTLRT